MRTIKENKKGQVGLDTAKVVMLSLLSLAVMGVLAIILLGNLKDTNVASNTALSSAVDTIFSVNHSAVNLLSASAEDCSATVTEARNSTTLFLIPSTNYTVSGCTILYKTGQGNANGLNNSNWQVNYTYTYNGFASITRNVTTGASTFFGNTSTWFSLLAVVVIILIIAIVIFAVNRFGGREQQSGL